MIRPGCGVSRRASFRGIGGGSAAWAPARLTNLRADYDATLGITLVPATSDVSAWADQSGVGNHQLAASTGVAPLYVATGFNGGSRPYIEFDGATEYLRCVAFSWAGTTSPMTVSMVVQVVTPTASDALFQYSTGAPFANMDAGGLPSFQNTVVSTGTTAITTAKLLTMSWDGTTQRLYIGTTQEDSDANAGAATADSQTFALAAGVSGGVPAYLRFARFLVQRAAITTAELAQLSAYATATYGV